MNPFIAFGFPAWSLWATRQYILAIVALCVQIFLCVWAALGALAYTYLGPFSFQSLVLQVILGLAPVILAVWVALGALAFHMVKLVKRGRRILEGHRGRLGAGQGAKLDPKQTTDVLRASPADPGDRAEAC